jgi:leucyl-tRNA synthetase
MKSFENAALMNTIPSNLIKLTHALSKFPHTRSRIMDNCLLRLLYLMAPLTPCIAQHLLEHVSKRGGENIWNEFPFPVQVERLTLTVIVQVNGKTRGSLSISPNEMADLESIVKDGEIGAKWLSDKPIRKVIRANGGKVINFVV